MKTTLATESCFHCGHLIDLETDEYVRIDTLETIVKKKDKAYAHAICDIRAKEGYAYDDAEAEMMEERYSYPLQYEVYSDSAL